jgi:hypothetical protein
MRYEVGFYIPEDGILHSQRRENVESYAIALPNYFVPEVIRHWHLSGR